MTWIISIVCLIGTVFNVKKLRACFVLWTLGNAAWLIYDISCGLYSRALLDFVQLILAVWGIYEWGKLDHDA
ncbi:MAG: hypothetical protein HGA54_01635 [Actinobacteria bacterium]|nr:hypothetical protein [Actinomycetota bacterium]